MTSFYSTQDPHILTNQGPPYIVLLVGLLSLSLGVFCTCTGKALSRGGGWVYRAEDPNGFWGWVVMYYLCGISSLDTIVSLYKSTDFSE
jgi:hypothetical protein